MSEYWVSHKRYHCKYCNIYIADDKPSRQQHENGLRHKGNVERFVRGLYKDGEKRTREREEERGIMARVGRAAEAAYALDVAAGRAAGASSSATPASKPKPKAARPSDPYANYSTAASLGYRDPEEQKVHAGTPGAWTVVAETTTTTTERGEASKRGEKRGVAETGQEDSEDVRAFKLRRKTAGVGLDEIYDPGRPNEPKPDGPSLFRKRRGKESRLGTQSNNDHPE